MQAAQQRSAHHTGHGQYTRAVPGGPQYELAANPSFLAQNGSRSAHQPRHFPVPANPLAVKLNELNVELREQEAALATHIPLHEQAIQATALAKEIKDNAKMAFDAAREALDKATQDLEDASEDEAANQASRVMYEDNIESIKQKKARIEVVKNERDELQRRLRELDEKVQNGE